MKRFWPKKITIRVIFFVLISVVLIHLVFLTIYTQSNRQIRHEASRNNMIQKIMNMVHMVNGTPWRERARAIKATEDPRMTISLTKTPKWKMQFKELSYWSLNAELRKDLYYFKFSIKLHGRSWLNVSGKFDTETMMLQMFLIFSELIVALAILLSIWVINRFTVPLRNFKRAAEQLGVDMDAKPLTMEHSPSIVKETAHAMNQMQSRIQDLIRDRTQMLAAISHDLRTPITRLKLRAQFVPEEEQRIKMISDLDEMEMMISQTLEFAKDDHDNESKIKLDLCSLMQVICDDFNMLDQVVAYESKICTAAIKGVKLGLTRAFNNLINNAIKYGNKAAVSIDKINKDIVVTITDNGEGLPEDELEKVFSPFYRACASRNRTTGGTGLGLAVTRDIIRRHGGKISLTNIPSGGLKAEVILRSL